MIHSSTYRLLISLVLSTLLLSAYVGRELIHLSGHEHEHSEFHCEVEGINQHLHQGETELHDCLLADFQISPLEPLENYDFSYLLRPQLRSTLPHYQAVNFSGADWELPAPRGPPNLSELQSVTA